MMSVGTILLIVLVVLLIGAAPTWGYHDYGWRPGGLIVVVLVVILVLLLLGKI
jgi:hypothetical protein